MAIFTEKDTPYTTVDLGFDKSLVKTVGTGELGDGDVTPELLNIFLAGTAPKTITAGELVAQVEQTGEVIFSGKTGFNNTQTGYRLGVDSADGLIKFYIGNTTDFLNWTGTALTITGGTVSLTTGVVGGFTITGTALTATDLILSSANQSIVAGSGASSVTIDANDASQRLWAGAVASAAAPFRVSPSGVLVCTAGGSLTGTWSDLGTVTTIDINGGTLDGVTIGGTSAAAATITTLTVTSIVIGANTINTSEWANLDGLNQTVATTSSPTFNALTVTSIIIGANTINTSEWANLDGLNQTLATTSNPTFGNLTITSFAANWTNAGRTVADMGILTTVDINGGTLDGVTIGGSSAAAATVTSLTDTGLTSGRVVIAGASGILTDDGDMTFSVDTLTATKIVGSTSVKAGSVAGFISSDGSTGATGTIDTTAAQTITVKDGIITNIA